MKKVTIFSWGYWGWGSSAAQFIEAADAVEASRGFDPPLFVDIRLQRSVRAANFNGNAFKQLVDEKRYRWMSKLGNQANAGETTAQKRVKGEIGCSSWNGWQVTLTSPGVMGPYSFVPFMECNHGILSMDHALTGELSVGEAHTCLEGGRGYVEKDWGRGFPRGYVWAQSNHFAEEGISISASVARIPWLSGAFRGYLIGFLLRGKLHRFTTYTGASIESFDVDENRYRL